MKTIHYLSIIILSFSSQILLAQNDTLGDFYKLNP